MYTNLPFKVRLSERCGQQDILPTSRSVYLHARVGFREGIHVSLPQLDPSSFCFDTSSSNKTAPLSSISFRSCFLITNLTVKLVPSFFFASSFSGSTNLTFFFRTFKDGVGT